MFCSHFCKVASHFILKEFAGYLSLVNLWISSWSKDRKQTERKGQFFEWHPPETSAHVVPAMCVESTIQAGWQRGKIVLTIQRYSW